MPGLVNLNGIEPEPDQQIGGFKRVDHQAVGRHAADDAHEVRRRLVDDAFHLGGHGYGKVPPRQPLAQARRDGLIDAQSDQHERAFRFRQFRLERQCRRSRVGAVNNGVVTMPVGRRRARRHRLDRLSRRQRHVRHAVGTLHAGVEREPDGVAGIRARDLLDHLAHRPVSVVQGQQLVRVAGWKFVGDLRRDGEERFLIEVRARHRQEQVGGAGAERGDYHARLPSQFAVDRGGNSRVGLVPHQHEVDADFPQLVDQDEHFTTRQAERPVNPSICQGPRHRRRRRRHRDVD